MNLTIRIPRLLAPALRRWTVSHSTAAPHTLTDPGAPDYLARYRNPPGLWTSPRLTQLVEVQGARLIYLSGQAPADADYRVRSREIRAQINACYDNIETALKSVGAGLQQIIKTTTYLVDDKYIQDLREVRTARYQQLAAPPANTMLIVKRLAEPEFLVEIDVIAALPAR